MSRIIKSPFANVTSTRPIILRPEKRPGAAPQDDGAGTQDMAPESLFDKTRRECDEMLKKAGEKAEEARREAESAAQERDRIMRETEIEARKLIDSVHGQAEEYRKQVREEAERQGRREGMEQAAADVAEIIKKAEEECAALILKASEERDAVFSGIEPEIFKLSVRIASKILNYELDRNESAYMEMVKKALSGVKFDSNVTLRVNPGEYVRFFKARDVTLHTPTGAVHSSVVSDPMVEFNGCRIETDMGNVSAGVGDQLSQIAKGLGVPDALNDGGGQD